MQKEDNGYLNEHGLLSEVDPEFLAISKFVVIHAIISKQPSAGIGKRMGACEVVIMHRP
ncbi:hypothetical protein M378DRAFT_170746 [Amanita muscaria Koide BX008]|uniref:Uncharacterized protein n=1 Tax=Amanita muscaria (strain Koide BX008) TaxID=946122 RepID=A0A0C2SW24_AMAMK|nr:hypothetical protein M378DRAFT_170746 [Amanita muscaria Koide BX008]